MFNFSKRIEKEVQKQLARKEVVDKYEADKRAVIQWLVKSGASVDFGTYVSFGHLKCGCQVCWYYDPYEPLREFEPKFRRCHEHQVPFEGFPVG